MSEAGGGPAPRDTTAAAPFRVGLLGHGTVGSAFAALLAERADEVAAVTGLRPELTGVLTRSRGDFEDILARSDLVVELMGGLQPARDYVLRAMSSGRHVVTANKQLLSRHGEELWSCARENGVELRFEAAVAGVTITSPARGSSSSASWMRMSPDSQCLPTRWQYVPPPGRDTTSAS